MYTNNTNSQIHNKETEFNTRFTFIPRTDEFAARVCQKQNDKYQSQTHALQI